MFKKMIPILILFLFGCNNTAPKCSSIESKESIINIVKETLSTQLNNKNAVALFSGVAARAGLNFNSSLFKNIKFSVKNIRTTDINKDVGSFACKADLKAILGQNKISKTISYTSELVDDGEKFFLQIEGFTEEMQGVFLSLLLVKADTETNRLTINPIITKAIKDNSSLEVYQKDIRAISKLLINKYDKSVDEAKWIQLRNQCETKTSSITTCLRSVYKKYIIETSNKYITILDGSYSPPETIDVKIENNLTLYLLHGFSYKYGIISNYFWVSYFEGEEFKVKNSICELSHEEEGGYKSGDKHCNNKYAKDIFAKKLEGGDNN